MAQPTLKEIGAALASAIDVTLFSDKLNSDMEFDTVVFQYSDEGRLILSGYADDDEVELDITFTQIDRF